MSDLRYPLAGPRSALFSVATLSAASGTCSLVASTALEGLTGTVAPWFAANRAGLIRLFTKILHQVTQMGADGAFGDRQCFRDLSVGQSAGNLVQDFLFALGPPRKPLGAIARFIARR